jgi:hypothetical protein
LQVGEPFGEVGNLGRWGWGASVERSPGARG